MNINNTSLDSFFQGAGVGFPFFLKYVYTHLFTQSTNSVGVDVTDRTCLIMDEVDGMSAGDRGGVGALNALIKKSKVRQTHFSYRVSLVD